MWDKLLSFQDFFSKPLYQSLLFLVLTLMVSLLSFPRKTDTVWVIAGVIYILFILVNSIMIFKVNNHWSYFFISLLFSVLYLLATAMVVKLVSKLLTTEGAEESSMIFLVIIYHPPLLLFFILIKWLFF